MFGHGCVAVLVDPLEDGTVVVGLLVDPLEDGTVVVGLLVVAALATAKPIPIVRPKAPPDQANLGVCSDPGGRSPGIAWPTSCRQAQRLTTIQRAPLFRGSSTRPRI